MTASDGIRVPLLDKLVPSGFRPGTMFLVEYDPDSQWFAVATTIAARFFEANHYVGYLAMARSVEDVRRELFALGLDLASAEKSGRLMIEDWYSASLAGGRLEPSRSDTNLFEPIPGGLRLLSLKIADLSVKWLKTTKSGPHPIYDIVDFWPAGSLIIAESCSGMLRFNEEKAFVEWVESRVNPEERKRKSITLQAFARGIHSERLYKRMENASDAVIDIRVTERGEESKNMLRLRTLRGQPHDTRWHEIAVNSTGEATLST